MMDILMAEAEKLKKVQPEGEPIRWSPGACARLPERAPFVCALTPGP